MAWIRLAMKFDKWDIGVDLVDLLFSTPGEKIQWSVDSTTREKKKKKNSRERIQRN